MARSLFESWYVSMAQLVFDIITFWMLHRTMPRTPTAKNWCFTKNNYQESWKEDIQAAISSVEERLNCNCEYVLIAKETGESGTPHLQGFISFSKAITRPSQNIFQAHWEVAKDVAASIAYCKKGEQSKEEWTRFKQNGPNYGVNADYWEQGQAPRKRGRQGERCELEDFRNTVKESFDSGNTFTPKMARESFPKVAAQYPKFVAETIADYKPKRMPAPHALNEWQQILNNELNLEADDRTIHFIVDVEGNKGKSWFSMYYRSLHDNVQIISAGTFANMAYSVNESTRVFFIDLPRESLDFFPYKFLEKLKDGFVASHKYVPCEKEWSHNAHVVVMMNQLPDMSKLSSDRVKITEI